MKILICGSRKYSKRDKVVKFVQSIHLNDIILHGDCPDSPDVWADEEANNLGIVCGRFPYVKKRGVYGGHVRNDAMLGMCDKVVAFWNFKSRGTKSVIEKAQMLNIPVQVILDEEGKWKAQ